MVKLDCAPAFFLFFQLQEWSKALNLSYEDVYSWFRIKWKAKLEYEAAAQKVGFFYFCALNWWYYPNKTE